MEIALRPEMHTYSSELGALPATPCAWQPTSIYRWVFVTLVSREARDHRHYGEGNTRRLHPGGNGPIWYSTLKTAEPIDCQFGK